MSDNLPFYHFYFKPKKLIEERLLVEKKFKQVEKDIAISRLKRLPNLIELIRSQSLDDIDEFSKKLIKMDILLLIYEYPYPDETNETRKKINQILTTRYTYEVGKTAWELFQQDIKDSFLQDLIIQSYKKNKEAFLGIDEDFLKPLGHALEFREGIINGLAVQALNTKWETQIILSEWKIKEGSVLEKAILERLLSKGLSEDFIINRDGPDFITKCLERFYVDEYKKLLSIYLDSRNHNQYNNKILNQSLRRLNDPRVSKSEWSFLSEDTFKKVLKWLLSIELKKFFAKDVNSERFDYWKKFIDYIDSVTPVVNPLVAFIYFDQFVIVEFANKGNAAYFYHRDGFNKFILPKLKNRQFLGSSSIVRESMLKDRTVWKKNGTKLFIDKLNHSGNWQWHFDIRMSTFLNGV